VQRDQNHSIRREIDITNLNIGIGYKSQSTPIPLDIDIQADYDKTLEGIDICCDLAHLPFRNDAFEKVYCFHVLEHIDKPIEGLKELIRVCNDTVEIEVPHRISHMAKSSGHKASFGCMWFYQCLRQFVFCLKTPWDFPRNIVIHVWIYPHVRRTNFKDS